MKRCAVWIVAAAFGAVAQGAIAQSANVGGIVADAPVTGTWIQLEAQPTLTAAETRVRVYAGQADATTAATIAGFSVGPTWYAVVSGPYADRAAAQDGLRALRAQGLAPSDAFLTNGDSFSRRFWPVAGATVATAPAVTITTPPATAPDTARPGDPAAAPDAAPQIVVTIPSPAPEESLQDARVSEQALTQEQKEQLQTALGDAGFYDATVDGAFGRGTRAAMEAWQLANGFSPTGVLTTTQRKRLVDAYNAVLAGLDLQRVRDSAAGVEVLIPTAVVTFAGYEPPFARFGPAGDLPAQVLLISQTGDANRLAGLYEILQTLDIFPADGPRARTETGFEIAGTGSDLQSYATATLTGDTIKGFALIWPAGDAARFERLRSEMAASFTATDGVLDPALTAPGTDQAIDLIAGLEIRTPKTTRSGFYIDDRGRVLTDATGVADCEDITIDGTHTATATLVYAALGLAVLTPQDALSPLAVAAFQTQVPRLQTEVAVAGYPYGGVLARPALTFGRLADVRGLDGDDGVKRVALRAAPGDAGGPVYDNSGAVLGMLLPRATGGDQVLPDDVAFLRSGDAIVAALTGAGIAPQTTDTLTFMPPEALTRRAADTTVLVSCW
ncbi:Putative peptidoglycan binding domain-containing protein [Loktanella fryxellensis]|uniref:Putative peptidoglycan binding domain-containing protein n=1 Tax=Loktanella fryxellensis TaxID=245187 RepID=A0A1H8GHE8_9RHOB|nr:trypsin-like peptidase domain-containing protein [Loktanella fryxellensis]SEN42907.1 Putative peptidoglycan binding domain-containing protein [Loktanella fryxellensis]